MRSTLSARVRAVEVLREVLRARRPRDRAAGGEVARSFARRRSSPARDRARRPAPPRDARRRALRRFPRAAVAAGRPDLREILEVALYQIRNLDRVPAYAAVDEAVAHAKRTGGTGAAGLVNAVLRNLLRQSPLAPREGTSKGSTRRAGSLASSPTPSSWSPAGSTASATTATRRILDCRQLPFGCRSDDELAQDGSRVSRRRARRRGRGHRALAAFSARPDRRLGKPVSVLPLRRRPLHRCRRRVAGPRRSFCRPATPRRSRGGARRKVLLGDSRTGALGGPSRSTAPCRGSIWSWKTANASASPRSFPPRATFWRRLCRPAASIASSSTRRAAAPGRFARTRRSAIA